MQLTEKQIQQANKLIKKYKFCNLETQKELQENGFFEAVKCNFCIADIGEDDSFLTVGFVDSIQSFMKKKTALLTMPQFHEVWAILIKDRELTGIAWEITLNNICVAHENIAVHYYDNICEAACKLWLKLKKENLL